MLSAQFFAQLNSGPQVWLVDDTSTQGTQVQDDETSRNNWILGISQKTYLLDRKVGFGVANRLDSEFDIGDEMHSTRPSLM